MVIDKKRVFIVNEKSIYLPMFFIFMFTTKIFKRLPVSKDFSIDISL